MGRDGDGDGAVESHYRIYGLAGVSWERFGTAVRFISSHFLCFVLCFISRHLHFADFACSFDFFLN